VQELEPKPAEPGQLVVPKTNRFHWLFLVFFGWGFAKIMLRNQQVVGSNPTGGSRKSN